ncbi:uncharacterized protein LOC117563156 [Gymnodraco acuticeps]|uniref:Uncharacterized protein LOC117563156 n=1 Tax=Gymnodraco acuticeps TaxID=8218 RepID=A0A6P8W0T7_GYMAC|nr:uncharacterized protein LOC117563156 [Gymnodraco acuticeps]
MRQHKRRFKSLNWTSVMATGIRSVHPHCCFVFKSHSVRTVGSKRKGSLFSCVGYCRFDDCPVEVEVDIEDESSLKAVVTFRGEKAWHNCEELKHRPVRADERDALANALTSKLPRSVYLDKLNKLDDTVLASGNRDQVPSTGVMKTLSWQARKKLRKHSNEMISLRKMMEEELETEEAVIKKIIAHPKGVMLWSNKTIDLFHDRCREDIVYVDATGSIVKKAKGKTSPFYVYEMVVRNPFKGSSPVPVATYITNDHTIASISFFLGHF